MKTPYRPVPVEVARLIAERYAKSQIIILSFDPVHQATHTTTYGVSPEDKEGAAAGGVIASLALGNDLSRRRVYQDYKPANVRAMEALLHELAIQAELPTAIQQRVMELLKQLKQ